MDSPASGASSPLQWVNDNVQGGVKAVTEAGAAVGDAVTWPFKELNGRVIQPVVEATSKALTDAGGSLTTAVQSATEATSKALTDANASLTTAVQSATEMTQKAAQMASSVVPNGVPGLSPVPAAGDARAAPGNAPPPPTAPQTPSRTQAVAAAARRSLGGIGSLVRSKSSVQPAQRGPATPPVPAFSGAMPALPPPTPTQRVAALKASVPEYKDKSHVDIMRAETQKRIGGTKVDDPFAPEQSWRGSASVPVPRPRPRLEGVIGDSVHALVAAVADAWSLATRGKTLAQLQPPPDTPSSPQVEAQRRLAELHAQRVHDGVTVVLFVLVSLLAAYVAFLLSLGPEYRY